MALPSTTQSQALIMPFNDAVFNCMTKEIWSQEKKEWCCANEGLGCPPVDVSDLTAALFAKPQSSKAAQDQAMALRETPRQLLPQNVRCCPYKQCQSNCSQVGSLVGATITQQRLQARALINAGQYPSSCCVRPCSTKGLVGFVDPIMLAKAKLQSTLTHC